MGILLETQEVITLTGTDFEGDVDIDGLDATNTEASSKPSEETSLNLLMKPTREPLNLEDDDDMFLSQINVDSVDILKQLEFSSIKPPTASGSQQWSYCESVQDVSQLLTKSPKASTSQESSQNVSRALFGSQDRSEAGLSQISESAVKTQSSEILASLETPVKDDAARQHLDNLIERHLSSEDPLLKAWAQSNMADRKALNGIERTRSYRKACRDVVLNMSNFNANQVKWNEESFREFREVIFGLERLLRQKAADSKLNKIEKKYYLGKAEDMVAIIAKTKEINKLINDEKDFFDKFVHCLKTRIASNTVTLEKSYSAVKYQLKAIREDLRDINEIDLKPPESTIVKPDENHEKIEPKPIEGAVYPKLDENKHSKSEETSNEQKSTD